MQQKLVNLAAHIADVDVGRHRVAHVEEIGAVDVDQDIVGGAEAVGDVRPELGGPIFERIVQPLAEQHHMRRDDQIIVAMREEKIHHRLAHAVPGRQVRIEVRIIEKDRTIVVEEAPAHRRIDRVEFGIADDAALTFRSPDPCGT